MPIAAAIPIIAGVAGRLAAGAAVRGVAGAAARGALSSGVSGVVNSGLGQAALRMAPDAAGHAAANLAHRALSAQQQRGGLQPREYQGG